MTDDQMRNQPKEGLNSMAWYLWHTARWQDFANSLITDDYEQVLDQSWLEFTRLSKVRRNILNRVLAAEPGPTTT
jgi:hypothetical protein